MKVTRHGDYHRGPKRFWRIFLQVSIQQHPRAQLHAAARGQDTIACPDDTCMSTGTTRSYPKVPNLGSTVTLVVGVLSFNHSTRASRRQWIRILAGDDASARLFFVLPLDEPDSDSHFDDVLSFPIASADRFVIGKLLLQNAWYRFAVRELPKHVVWIARMDDDAAASLPAIAGQLDRLDVRPNEDRVVYGHHLNWYMWNPSSMQAVCWDYGPRNWYSALLRLKTLQRSQHSQPQPATPYATHHYGPPTALANKSMTRSTAAKGSSCLSEGTEGPYPFARGPFIAYSRPVAQLLVGLIDDDEAYVLGLRRQRNLVNVNTGVVQRPSQRSHPHNRIFMDEVYYAYLLYRELHDATVSGSNRLILVNELVHDILSKDKFYQEEFMPGAAPPSQLHNVYHKLRHASHFEALANRSYLRLRHLQQTRVACKPLLATSGFIHPPARRALRKMFGWRANWTICDFVPMNASRRDTDLGHLAKRKKGGVIHNRQHRPQHSV